MPMYNQRMGTRNWYLPQLLTAELRVQATSEDSLEHSEVQSPHWSGGEGKQLWDEFQSHR